jgi:TRAP-type C4-dicarboxylate transport system permease small subunit
VTILQTTERWLLRCEHVLVYAGVVAMLAMMCLTSADALSRYLLNRPILGAYEFTEKYLIVASIFLGLSYAYRGGMFIRVTFLVDRLPPALKVAVNIMVQLLTLAFCLLVLVATTQQALRGWQDDTTLSALPIPVGPAYSFVPLGFLALSVMLLIDLPRVRSNRSCLFREETTPL